jgi:hypothetical protein
LGKLGPDSFQSLVPQLVFGLCRKGLELPSLPVQAIGIVDRVHFLIQGCNPSHFSCIRFHSPCPLSASAISAQNLNCGELYAFHQIKKEQLVVQFEFPQGRYSAPGLWKTVRVAKRERSFPDTIDRRLRFERHAILHAALFLPRASAMCAIAQ